jgi:hypothetical protein
MDTPIFGISGHLQAARLGPPKIALSSWRLLTPEIGITLRKLSPVFC